MLVSLLFVAAAASFFGCHPVGGLTRSHEGTKEIDFLTPNPDVPTVEVAETATALKTALNL